MYIIMVVYLENAFVRRVVASDFRLVILSLTMHARRHVVALSLGL
jgi:hypothetical protein